MNIIEDQKETVNSRYIVKRITGTQGGRWDQINVKSILYKKTTDLNKCQI
jgi:hypothetical protein